MSVFQEKTHTTKEGKVIPLKSIEDGHLENIIVNLLKKAKAREGNVYSSLSLISLASCYVMEADRRAGGVFPWGAFPRASEKVQETLDMFGDRGRLWFVRKDILGKDSTNTFSLKRLFSNNIYKEYSWLNRRPRKQSTSDDGYDIDDVGGWGDIYGEW